MIEVVATGAQSLLQDLGRTGFSHIGVGPSGAFDRAALRLANRIVGNRETAVCIETLGGGLQLSVTEPTIASVTGADGPLTMTNQGVTRQVTRNSPLSLTAGDMLVVGIPTAGLRSYVSIRHGINVERILGSASTDTLADIGPTALVAGQQLGSASEAVTHPPVDLVVARPHNGPIDVIAGPRWDWFTATAQSALTGELWTISPMSSRIGIRLTGSALERVDAMRELLSEPMVTGAIQVPPNGEPIILGPDRPTTGGYPIIGVVTEAHLDRLAQLVPGETIFFRLVPLD